MLFQPAKAPLYIFAYFCTKFCLSVSSGSYYSFPNLDSAIIRRVTCTILAYMHPVPAMIGHYGPYTNDLYTCAS